MTEKEKETIQAEEAGTPAEVAAEQPAEVAEQPAEAASETAPEAASETVPEVAEEKPKHKYADRLAKAYPDRKFEKDEDYDAALEERFDENESYRERGTKANQKLIALFEAEPQVGAVVRDMMNGASFREALARHMSPEDLTAIEGDPDYEGWNKNKQAREEGASKRRKFEEDYASNLEFSKQAISEFAAENNMTEDQAESFLGQFDEMLAEINSGKITKENLARIKKAFDYDNDVAQAAEKGKIAGLNEKIVAEKEVRAEGDGLPRIAASSAEMQSDKPKAKPNYMDDLLERTKKKQVI